MSSKDQPARLHSTVTKLLNERLQVFVDRPLKGAVHSEIYEVIFNVITDVLGKANLQFTNEFANYVSKQYYDLLEINKKNDSMNTSIFTKIASLKSIPTGELAVMATMWSGLPMVAPVLLELKTRGGKK